MTIAFYITRLLGEYEGIEIETNHVKDGADQYGLFKAPSRDTKEMTDGSYEITEYYEFMARQPSLSSSERKEADEWMEDLTYWADDLMYNYELPPLGKGRRVMGLTITGSPYPMETDEEETLYHMSLSITYIREREV